MICKERASVVPNCVVINDKPPSGCPRAHERARELVPSKNKRFAEFARVLALEECALYAEFDPDAEAEGESEDDGAADSDYNSDDNSADAQMHRFFSKVESLGVPLCEDLADPWA